MTTADMDVNLMELEMPPTAEYVGTARLFAAEAVRHFGGEEETVADLKIAISEACTGAISAQEGAEARQAVRVSITGDDDSMQVEVFGPAGFESWTPQAPPPEGLGIGLGMGLVQALFPNAQFLKGQGPSSTLRIVIPAA